MNNKHEIGARLAAWRKSVGLRQADLAGKISRSQGFIGGIESGRQGPSSDLLSLLLEEFELSADWLLTGKQSYDAPNIAIDNFDIGNNQTVRQQTNPPIRNRKPSGPRPAASDGMIAGQEFTLVPRFRAKASAGGGLIPDMEDGESMVALPTSFLLSKGMTGQLTGIVDVEGDSMAPTIPHGSRVVVNLAETAVTRENIYVFTRDGAVFVKRIIPREFDSAGRPTVLTLVSDNPNYRLEILTKDELNTLRIAGRVRFSIVAF